MVIVYNALLCCKWITVFQLTERIGPVITKSSEAVYKGCMDVLGFSLYAIPSRHDVPKVLHL